MFTPEGKAERRERALAELAERGLALARDLQEAALAATGLDEKAKMASAFSKVSRAVRQGLWLDARLDQELVRQAEAAEARAVETAKVRRAERKEQVRLEMERILQDTLDEGVADIAIMDLENRIDLAALTPGFDDEAVDAVIARLRRFYGISLSPSEEMSRSDREGLASGLGEPPLRGNPPPSTPSRAGSRRETGCAAGSEGATDVNFDDAPPRRSSA